MTVSRSDSSALLKTLLIGLTLLFAALICGLLVVAAGENPWQVVQIFASGAWGTRYDFGLSLFYAIPIALAGLAVSLGLRSGLFNIGVEGQLVMGTLAASLTATQLQEHNWLLLFSLSSTAAMLAGGLWASILAWLKAFRGAHEVVAGIMLNTVAYGLSSWLVLQYFRNTASQNPESMPIEEALRLPRWEFFQDAPVSWHLLLAPGFGLVVYALYRWSRLGFALRLLGTAPEAARYAGYSQRKLEFLALVLGGLLAGAVGIAEVFGNTGRFVIGFSPGYGFVGIAVALLGRQHPLGIILASLLFGCLYKGSLELDFETQAITKDFALILQAIIILFISAQTIIPQAWQDKLLNRTQKV